MGRSRRNGRRPRAQPLGRRARRHRGRRRRDRLRHRRPELKKCAGRGDRRYGDRVHPAGQRHGRRDVVHRARTVAPGHHSRTGTHRAPGAGAGRRSRPAGVRLPGAPRDGHGRHRGRRAPVVEGRCTAARPGWPPSCCSRIPATLTSSWRHMPARPAPLPAARSPLLGSAPPSGAARHCCSPPLMRSTHARTSQAARRGTGRGLRAGECGWTQHRRPARHLRPERTPDGAGGLPAGGARHPGRRAPRDAPGHGGHPPAGRDRPADRAAQPALVREQGAGPAPPPDAVQLAMGDLDHFKALNDTHGHDAGDRALRLFSRTLRDAVRADDLVCRYGGEEFVVVFPGLSVDVAARALGRIQEQLVLALAAGSVPPFTASFGVAGSTTARPWRTCATADGACSAQSARDATGSSSTPAPRRT